MSFLVKRPNGMWNIVFPTSKGKRSYRSTKTRNITKAKAVHMEFIRNGMPVSNKRYYLSDLESAVLRNAEANSRKPKTILIYKSVFKHMKNTFKNFELKLMTIEDINEYIISRKKVVKNVSINLELRSMKSIFNYAYDNDMIFKDLSKKIKPLQIKDDKCKSFTKEEINLLFNNMEDSELKDIYSLLYLTGSRRNEILNIKYEDIDFTKGIINIYQEKPLKNTGLKRLPITDEMKNVLKKYFYTENNILIFHEPNEKLFKISPSYVTHSFKKIVRKHKLDDYLHLHSLRHSAGTHLTGNGAGLSQVKSILGHSSTKVTEGYVHLESNDLKDDLSKLSTGLINL